MRSSQHSPSRTPPPPMKPSVPMTPRHGHSMADHWSTWNVSCYSGISPLLCSPILPKFIEMPQNPTPSHWAVLSGSHAGDESFPASIAQHALLCLLSTGSLSCQHWTVYVKCFVVPWAWKALLPVHFHVIWPDMHTCTHGWGCPMPQPVPEPCRGWAPPSSDHRTTLSIPEKSPKDLRVVTNIKSGAQTNK